MYFTSLNINLLEVIYKFYHYTNLLELITVKAAYLKDDVENNKMVVSYAGFGQVYFIYTIIIIFLEIISYQSKKVQIMVFTLFWITFCCCCCCYYVFSIL